MDENKYTDPWDRDSYETGSTRPPKNHGGIVAALLIGVIFLGGITSGLGLLNIRLFRQLQTGGEESTSMSFFENTQSATSVTQPAPSADAPKVPADRNVTLELSPTPVGVENIPQEGGLSYQQIYTKAIDSVVSITCQLTSGTSSGTGMVLSGDGYIVTNCHVVEGAQSIRIRLTDERVLQASVVGADAVSDLAVLYVSAEDLTPAEFGDSRQLRVGDAVAAIGDPLGEEFRGTMTDGIVSAINRNVVTEGRTMTLIQTNAALNSGNSGGPLLNCYGQVIGINTMKIGTFTDSAGVEGLGFAIPSTTVKEVVEQLIAQGYVSGRPSLGITGSSVSAWEQRYYSLPAGVLVSEVDLEGCAADSGVVSGDIILYLDDTRVESGDDLTTALYGYEAGDTVTLTIFRYRTNQQFQVTLTLDEAAG